MNHSSSWACRLCTEVWAPMGPVWPSFLGAPAWLLCLARGSPFHSQDASCPEWLSSAAAPLAERLWGWAVSGHKSYLPGQPLPLGARWEFQKYSYKGEGWAGAGGGVLVVLGEGEGCKVPVRVFPNAERWLDTWAPKLVQSAFPLASLPSTGTAERGLTPQLNLTRRCE